MPTVKTNKITLPADTLAKLATVAAIIGTSADQLVADVLSDFIGDRPWAFVQAKPAKQSAAVERFNLLKAWKASRRPASGWLGVSAASLHRWEKNFRAGGVGELVDHRYGTKTADHSAAVAQVKRFLVKRNGTLSSAYRLAAAASKRGKFPSYKTIQRAFKRPLIADRITSWGKRKPD